MIVVETHLKETTDKLDKTGAGRRKVEKLEEKT